MSCDEETDTADSEEDMGCDENAVLIKELEDLCDSDELSLEALKDAIERIPPNSLQDSSFFHYTCLNKNVSLEMVEFILTTSPKLEEIRVEAERESCPLHAACSNSSCPDSVIELLVTRNPAAVRFIYTNEERTCLEGLPLHYYLTRETNIDLATVKMLVEAYAESLTTGDVSPIHALLKYPKTVPIFNVVQYLIETNESILRLADNDGHVPLHAACQSKTMDPKVVQLLVEGWQDAIYQTGARGLMPIHSLCHNHDLKETAALEILEHLLRLDTNLVREQNSDGRLPIHLAAQGNSVALCRALVEAYPESMKIQSDYGLPIHDACAASDNIAVTKYLHELYPEGIVTPDGRGGSLPIHFAAFWHNVPAIRYLLALDPEQIKKVGTVSGCLPLHEACSNRNDVDTDRLEIEAVELLYTAYPEGICCQNEFGSTPLDIARRRAIKDPDDAEVATFLEDRAEQYDPEIPPPDGSSCWICHGGPNEDGPLRRDCSCRGKSGVAHFSCIVSYAMYKSQDCNDVDGVSRPWMHCPNCRRNYQNRLGAELVTELVSIVEKNYPSDQIRLIAALDAKLQHVSGGEKMQETRQIATRILATIERMKAEGSSPVDLRWMESSAYEHLGKIAVNGGVESGEVAESYFLKCRDLFQEPELQLPRAIAESNLANAKLTFDWTSDNIEKLLEKRRALYEVYVEKTGEDSTGAIVSGLNVASALRLASQLIEGQRLSAKLVAISKRVHGPEHSITKGAEEILSHSLEEHPNSLGRLRSSEVDTTRCEGTS